jgi:hypothetical protein
MRTNPWAVAALTGFIACILVAGCSGNDDRAGAAQASQPAPVLPGTRGARADAATGAQRFETASPVRQRDALGPLLQPVMHSAD